MILDDFTVEILVGGHPIPEYRKVESQSSSPTHSECIVECNLTTPFSYKATTTEVVSGEAETQAWPVTPYAIRVVSNGTSVTPDYFRIMVDGIKIKGLSLEAGGSRIIKGFRDGLCIRELLFSLPRFATDVSDRVSRERYHAIGKIEVECWSARLRKTKWGLRRKYLDFDQANKKDSSNITNGKYTLATSRAGKVIASRSLYRSVDCWKLQSLKSKATITYHMSPTIEGLGFKLKPYNTSPVDMGNKPLVTSSQSARRKSAQNQPSTSQQFWKERRRNQVQSHPIDTNSDAEGIVLKEEIVSVSPEEEKTKPEIVDLTFDSDEEQSELISKTEVKDEVTVAKDVISEKLSKLSEDYKSLNKQVMLTSEETASSTTTISKNTEVKLSLESSSADIEVQQCAELTLDVADSSNREEEEIVIDGEVSIDGDNTGSHPVKTVSYNSSIHQPEENCDSNDKHQIKNSEIDVRDSDEDSDVILVDEIQPEEGHNPSSGDRKEVREKDDAIVINNEEESNENDDALIDVDDGELEIDGDFDEDDILLSDGEVKSCATSMAKDATDAKEGDDLIDGLDQRNRDGEHGLKSSSSVGNDKLTEITKSHSSSKETQDVSNRDKSVTEGHNNVVDVNYDGEATENVEKVTDENNVLNLKDKQKEDGT